MATVKKAAVIHEKWLSGKLIDQVYEHTVVYICQDLKEAWEWTEEHQDLLSSGERYDIYYRCELQ